MLRFKIARQRLCRLTAIMLLPIVCCAGVGLAIIPASVKDRSEPFPCQDCACACHNATACWQSCCCLTDAEKVSWAEQHDVQPPSFVLERLAEAARLVLLESASCSLCVEPSPARPNEVPAGSTAVVETRLVLFDAQSKCQGVGAWIALLSSALPVTHDVEMERDDVGVFYQDIREAAYLPPSFSPPQPPPRRPA